MSNDFAKIAELLERSAATVVLTGAGISTASGIPDYRDENGEWKHARPVQFQDFITKPGVRQRYWSRSLVGWPLMTQAQPNPAHKALQQLQQRGFVSAVITQNVDGLHQQCGTEDVIDLHGRLDEVRCLDCRRAFRRADWQLRISDLNPGFADNAVARQNKPDGDAEIDGVDLAAFKVPDCPTCGGIVKPEVVFFGEAVPPTRVQQSYDSVDNAELMLVVGSSLIVYSGFRFARRAHANNIPLVLINKGFNRAADLATLNIDADCGTALGAIVTALQGDRQAAPA